MNEILSDGELYARNLIAALCDSGNQGEPPEATLAAYIVDVTGADKASDVYNRLAVFCKVVAPLLVRGIKADNQGAGEAAASADGQRVIDAAVYTCCRVSDGRIIAASPEDEDAILTLAELQLAVRALEPKFTESEGGEL